MRRRVYFVSESTGITAEAMGHSLLSQFEDRIQFKRTLMPHVNTPEQAQELAQEFARVTRLDGVRPVVFATMMQKELGDVLRASSCLYLELFDHFLGELVAELGMEPSRLSGLSHSIQNNRDYEQRISVINYTMANDDGMRLDQLALADVILVGVSRSGKTPTSLYLAMHYGLRAANYPVTEEDFDRGGLPKEMLTYRHKIVGLTIDPERLHEIREERRPNSRYSALATCRDEVRRVQAMFDRFRCRVIDTTRHSIEEVASLIVKGRKGDQGHNGD